LPPLLLGLFQHLLAHGVPVGTRDYLDGIRAIQLGFGRENRASLHSLARALWARSDEERRLIDGWFDAVPLPSPMLLNEVASLRELEQSQPAGDVSTTQPVETRPEQPSSARRPSGTQAGREAPKVKVSFAAADQGEGLPVPRLSTDPVIAEEYVLQPRSPVSERELAVLWRRYRRPTRSRGPGTEPDIDATVRERCRTGLLSRPLYRPRRANSARLLVLIDVSASMDPWRPFLETLAASLPLGRLASANLHYFVNLPRKQFFASPALRAPVRREEVLSANRGAGLLIVSDGGSARGYLNRRRAMQTADFLAEVKSYCSAIVWVNPMPATRWTNTTAELIAAHRSLSMLPTDAASLLRGIDILRGNK
jgi:uncharacterized protein with von Willebrand factor type A (vWA) domain